MDLLDKIKELSELMRIEEYHLIKEIKQDKLLFTEAKKSLSDLIQQSIDFLDSLDPVEGNNEVTVLDTRC